MLATNTHDTKRSADLRARLDTLSEMPAVWSRYVARWRRLNKPRKRTVAGKPTPDTNAEYLYYQTLLGLWPAPRPERRVDDLPDRAWLERARERLVAYMLKAAREAKTRTSWTESDAEYETALDAFVRETLQPHEDAPFLPDVARLTAQTADGGFRASLARVLLQCTSPGTPDIYQGDEVWNFTLVDPDNRRPVDFRQRARLLSQADAPEFLRDAFARFPLGDDRVKLALLARLLHFRRDHARLFGEGDYVPLLLDGAQRPAGVFAFARRLDGEVCIVLVRTCARESGREEETSATATLPGELAGEWRSVLTGRSIELVRVDEDLEVRVDDLVGRAQSCELLIRATR
jgi:(1->4)-alpha-D-glucan 1-alpha-D-glucosylmutase